MWILGCLLRKLFHKLPPEVIADAFYRSTILESDPHRRALMWAIINKLHKREHQL